MSLISRIAEALLSRSTLAGDTPGTIVFNPEAAVETSLPGDAPEAPEQPTYAPEHDGDPDPGEVVWAWVPYEEDVSQGKDRPVLLLYREERGWAALQLTSKDHDRDMADEARWGRYWMDVGSGGWDREGRPSEVRLDRVIHLPDSGIRREGAALDKAIFDQVIEAARPFHEWPE